jgi:hypothetical protein
MARLAFILARLVVAVFVLLTALYCLLAYIPFTYHQIHLGGLLAWVTAFAKYHPYLYWPAFLAAALTVPSLRQEGVRFLTAAFLCVYGAIGVWLFFKPLLVNLDNSIQSLYWCLAALTPLMWIALLDWLAQRGNFDWEEPEASEVRRLFHACLLGALYAWLLTSVIVIVRYAVVTNAGFGAMQWVVALSLSLIFHITVFLAIFLVVNFFAALARMAFNLAAKAFFYILAVTAMFALILKFVVFAPLSFTGSLATWTALAFAFSLVFFLSGISVRLYHSEDGAVASPLELLLSPLRFLQETPRSVQVLLLIIVSVAIGFALIAIRTNDWQYMLQKMIIVATWAGIIAFFYMTAQPSDKSDGGGLIVTAAVVLCLFMGAVVLQPHWASASTTLSPQGFAFLDEYSNYDIGFRLGQGILSPPPAAAPEDDSLYTFLVSNTNIPQSTHTEPVNFKLDGELTPSSGPKPNIFIVVIDSLRRDYLSSYNPDVNFTPGIDAFARESVVFQNGFTRYTGTGLSEPSIWTGTLQLHKQYITPYYPMNSLQKLLEAEGYQQIIARDEILKVIMGPSKSITDMDAEESTMNLKLCPALTELQQKVGAIKASGRPIFSYMQPQDIHVSVINKEHRSVPAGESYPGFDDAYASRVKAMDRCFGDFVQFLKNTGMYDNSIVILSADHGDSLGERGLWGHAYNLVPETARVPIIIHLPVTMRSLAVSQGPPAFLTDITPSLYYLLGHKPIEKKEVFGRPLFTVAAEEATPYIRSSYLLASSYAPVYGVLSDGGHSLYVVDGVEYKDALYEWSDKGRISVSSVSSDVRAQKRQQIRDFVNDINHFFNFGEQPAAPGK